MKAGGGYLKSTRYSCLRKHYVAFQHVSNMMNDGSVYLESFE